MRLDKIFKNSLSLEIDDTTKIVVMSDCHRGVGDSDDNFIKNENIFKAALLYYYSRGFTYIELGDGDEMWEVKNISEIVDEHLDTFKQLKKFHDSGRLIMIYGNHDWDKSYPSVLKKYFYTYYDRRIKKREALLDDLRVYESVVLKYQGHDLFMIHGHQASIINGGLKFLSKFFVRYFWRYLERVGFKDPTSAAKNYNVSKMVEKRLRNWSEKKRKIIIAGHTHRPIFPDKGLGLYFNDGSCVHPNGITCIEIENGNISLVKWSLTVKNYELIAVIRNVIAGPEAIIDFFKD